MFIHKEGHTILITALIVSVTIYFVLAMLTKNNVLTRYIAGVVLLFFLSFLVFFFRNPQRRIVVDNTKVLSPADGKIVAVEEVFENEYLKCKCIRVSIFMSVWDVHVNRYPVSGRINYSQYHPGKYLVASYPKASELNEHHSAAIETDAGITIFIKQIAGIVARRVVCYAEKDKQVVQGDDLGFVKFGSRVDIFLPPGTEILVKLNDEVTGNRTIIARFNP